jgi:hypothetical protein
MFEAILDKKLNADRGFIKPKRKPPEELERLKRENFERAAPGLENPDEVKQMLGLADGGRTGYYAGNIVEQEEPNNIIDLEESNIIEPTDDARYASAATLGKIFLKPMSYISKKIYSTKKGPETMYTFRGPTITNKTRTQFNSKNLNEVLKEREKILGPSLQKMSSLAEKGFVNQTQFKERLKNVGMQLRDDPGANLVTQFANKYGIKKVKSPLGDGYLYQVPKNLKEIVTKRANIIKLTQGDVEKFNLAKQLVASGNIKSRAALNRKLKELGYPTIRKQKLDELFPKLKGTPYDDYIPLAKDTAKEARKTYAAKVAQSGPKTELILKKVKKASDYGKEVHTMHTTPKYKKTGKLLLDDLSFGSAKENLAYAGAEITKKGGRLSYKKVTGGFDGIRDSLRRELNRIKNNYTMKNMNDIITVPKRMREKHNLPKNLRLDEYLDRINKGLTNLAYKTDGKVRGELLINTKGGKFQFVNNPVVNFKNIPGMGAVKGKVKDFDKLMSKIKVEKNSVILDKNGIPFIKEGVKLTEREADTIFMIFSNLRNQLPAAAKSKPFKGKLDLKTGGYVSTLPMYEQALMGGGRVGFKEGKGLKALGRRIMNEPGFKETLAADLGISGYLEILKLLGMPLGLMGGGIVGIRKPSAIPPEKGPQPQGLDYLRYYGT